MIATFYFTINIIGKKYTAMRLAIKLSLDPQQPQDEHHMCLPVSSSNFPGFISYPWEAEKKITLL